MCSRIFVHFSEVSCLSAGHALKNSFPTQNFSFIGVWLHLLSPFGPLPVLASSIHFLATSPAIAVWWSPEAIFVTKAVNSASLTLPLASSFGMKFIQWVWFNRKKVWHFHTFATLTMFIFLETHSATQRNLPWSFFPSSPSVEMRICSS